MNSNNKTNLSVTNFLSYKPMVYAKTKRTTKCFKLISLQVAIPVPNSSFCISGKPKLTERNENQEVTLDVKIEGKAKGAKRKAGQMLFFSMKPMLSLPNQNDTPYDLVVKVKIKDGTRPTQVGKSVLKTIDEED